MGTIYQVTNQTHFDLVILGSGSTAFAAALRAQELGKTAVMTEARTLGGTCVNRGCLPSKNLIEAAKLVYDAQHPRYPGLTPASITLDFAALIQQKDEIIASYRNKKYDSLLGSNIFVVEGHAELVDAHTVQVGNQHLTGEAILIATGSRPVAPAIDGLDTVPYLTSDLLTHHEAMELTACPQSLIIIGGGYIALELGQMFHRFGTKVTILERSGQVLAHGYEPQVGQAIGTILTQEGVHIVTEASIQSVRSAGQGIVAQVQVNGALQTFQAEKLLVATGRRPNTETIGVDRVGIVLGDRGQVQVNEYLQTNVPHIFAAGDVIGYEQHSQMATPVGSQDGGIVALNALSGQTRRAVDHRVIPRAIFTDPQIGIVGMTEQEAIAAGHRCWCRTVPMTLVPRAGAIRDPKGLIKMVADADTDEVLGVSMVGHSAAEVIHEAAMAMRFHAKIQDFIDLIHVYPTMAEALKIAAISRYKDPAKLSCCAE